MAGRELTMYEKLVLAREARELGRQLRDGKSLGFRPAVGYPRPGITPRLGFRPAIGR